MPIDPEDLERYGVDPDSLIWSDVSGASRFLEDHPEWTDDAGRSLSWQSSIIANAAGVGPPSTWSGVTIIGANDGSSEGSWSVEIVDDQGNTYLVDLDEVYDLAWDFYDAARWYDFDIEKDIDTGWPE